MSPARICYAEADGETGSFGADRCETIQCEDLDGAGQFLLLLEYPGVETRCSSRGDDRMRPYFGGDKDDKESWTTNQCTERTTQEGLEVLVTDPSLIKATTGYREVWRHNFSCPL